MRLQVVKTAFMAVVMLICSAVHADYPERPIKLVVPISAGSTVDFVARVVAEALQKSLGQPVVVENVAGAGGTIGTAAVARAGADGYTLLVASSAHTVNPVIYKNLSYDTVRDFRGISALVGLPNILLTGLESGITSVDELVRRGRAHPGKLTFGSGGVGSGAHMNAELFRAKAGFEAMHVPFKGSPEVLNELLAGRIDFAFVPITTALSYVRSGKLRALAVGSSVRSPLLPDIPTTEESGINGSAHNEWVGMYVRAGTSDVLIRLLNREMVRILKDGIISDRLATVGATVIPGTPEDVDAKVKSGIVSVRETIKLANISIN